MNMPVTDTRVISHFINGRNAPATGGREQDIFNPATGAVIGQVQLASEADVHTVASAARAAADSWANESLTRRTQVLFSMREKLLTHRDEMAALITREHGKVLDDARGEVNRAREAVEFTCGIMEQLKGEYSDQIATDIDTFSYRQPLGVIAGITPFNFPAMVPMWMAPVAIATGNAFILKPSERDPSTALMLARLWQEAGLPDGVFNVLQGDKVAVDGLLTHPGIDGVSFVGSTPIARYVHQTASLHGKRVQALGGAKNHVVVLPDADMDLAATHIAAAAFGAAGERCMAVSVAIAVGDAADALAARLRERARNVIVSEGTDPKAEMGPLITAQSRDRVKRIIGEAENDGAALVCDGRNIRVKGHEDGFFVGPTILDKVEPGMSAYREEIFGPVLSIMRVASFDEAIQIINQSPYGNGTAIFTGSGSFARRFQRRVKIGMVGVNVPIPVPVAWHSFGGWNESLFGDLHVNGSDGVLFTTRKKVVTQRWPEPTDPSGASLMFPSHN